MTNNISFIVAPFPDDIIDWIKIFDPRTYQQKGEINYGKRA